MPALRVIVMGVSGCGKSTVAAGLAQALGLAMVDGDDLHLSESVAKMRNGIALDDADRWPWLDRIGARLAQEVKASSASQEVTGDKDADAFTGCAIACSALKRSYRDRLRHAAAPLQFIFLDGDADLIAERMARRTGHYMQPDLLASQIRTLERPGADESDVLRLSITQDIPTLIAQAVASLKVQQAVATD